MYIAPNRPAQILRPGLNSLTYSPYPDFASGGNFTTFAATGSYNSVQSTYEHRLAQGLNVLANFTYSKCLTDGRDFLNATAIGSFRAATLPGFGIAGDYGACDYDVPRVLHVSGSYELPVGQGLNAATLKYGDLAADGVIDPVKVTRSAVLNAASVARMVLTTETAIVEKPADEDEHAGHGHHHH